MIKAFVYTVVLQFLVLGLSGNLHAVEVAHDDHAGAHVHFDAKLHSDAPDAHEHENDNHFHPTLVFIPSINSSCSSPAKGSWTRSSHSSLVSQRYSPPVPPPNSYA